jgi:hypothetical protein
MILRGCYLLGLGVAIVGKQLAYNRTPGLAMELLFAAQTSG